MSDGWTAIVLAGERPGGDPLARECGVPAKALITIEGRTMLARVLEALLQTPGIARIAVLAQDTTRLRDQEPSTILDNARVTMHESGAGIANSVAAIAGSAAAPWPVLVTTADNALLTAARVTAFLDGSAAADLSIGFGARAVIEARFPDARRTWLRFADGQYSGANLFALLSPRCQPALAHWSGVEQDRKKGLKLIASFGPWLLLRVITRSITLPEALRQAGDRLGMKAVPVLLDAEAAVDVDKADDLALVTQVLQARR